MEKVNTFLSIVDTSKSLEIPENFTNFHSCLLVFMIISKGNTFHTQENQKNKEPFGFLPDLSKVVASQGNATSIMQIPTADKSILGFDV